MRNSTRLWIWRDSGSIASSGHCATPLFIYLLMKQVYDSLFLLFSKCSCLQLACSNTHNSFVISRLSTVSFTCHMGSQYYLLPDTSEQTCLNPSQQAGTQFTYCGGMEGWVDLVAGYILRWCSWQCKGQRARFQWGDRPDELLFTFLQLEETGRQLHVKVVCSLQLVLVVLTDILCMSVTYINIVLQFLLHLLALPQT